MLKIIQLERGTNIFEVDSSMYEEVLAFLKSLAKKKNKSFSYIDDMGDIIMVVGDKEYVIPTREDLENIMLSNEDDFVDEEVVKKELNV